MLLKNSIAGKGFIARFDEGNPSGSMIFSFADSLLRLFGFSLQFGV